MSWKRIIPGVSERQPTSFSDSLTTLTSRGLHPDEVVHVEQTSRGRVRRHWQTTQYLSPTDKAYLKDANLL